MYTHKHQKQNQEVNKKWTTATAKTATVKKTVNAEPDHFPPQPGNDIIIYMDNTPVDLISSYIEENIVLSDLPPKATTHLHKTLTTYLQNQLINHSDNYPQLIKELYTLNDNKQYSLLALATTHTGYHMFLFPQTALIMTPVKTEYIKWLKENFVFKTGPEIGELVGKAETVFKTLRELNHINTRTRRTAKGYGKKDITFPTEEKLQRFYECERKKPYNTLAEAEQCHPAYVRPCVSESLS